MKSNRGGIHTFVTNLSPVRDRALLATSFAGPGCRPSANMAGCDCSSRRQLTGDSVRNAGGDQVVDPLSRGVLIAKITPTHAHFFFARSRATLTSEETRFWFPLLMSSVDSENSFTYFMGKSVFKITSTIDDHHEQ